MTAFGLVAQVEACVITWGAYLVQESCSDCPDRFGVGEVFESSLERYGFPVDERSVVPFAGGGLASVPVGAGETRWFQWASVCRAEEGNLAGVLVDDALLAFVPAGVRFNVETANVGRADEGKAGCSGGFMCCPDQVACVPADPRFDQRLAWLPGGEVFADHDFAGVGVPGFQAVVFGGGCNGDGDNAVLGKLVAAVKFPEIDGIQPYPSEAVPVEAQTGDADGLPVGAARLWGSLDGDEDLRDSR